MKVEVTTDANAEDREYVRSELRKYNNRFLDPRTTHLNYCEICVFLRNDEDEISGGAIGNYGWDWVYLDLLWVDDENRGDGWGRRLLEDLEHSAKELGAVGIHLSTTSFQARAFYERIGYWAFGQLEDYPRGFTTYFMAKTL